MSFTLLENDLAHIRAVLNHLERRALEMSSNQPGREIGLDYWRARIGATLAMPMLPVYLRKQAEELLARLVPLDTRQQCVLTGS